jgi:hypothetical protein
VEKFFEAARAGGGLTELADTGNDAPTSALADATGVSMTRAELTSAAGLSDAQLAELESYGLVEPIEPSGDRPLFDEGALVVAQAAAKFMQFGIEPRHLRMYKAFTDRELNLFAQVVQPLRRPNRPEAGERADATVDELVQLGQRLRAGLLHRAGSRSG